MIFFNFMNLLATAMLIAVVVAGFVHIGWEWIFVFAVVGSVWYVIYRWQHMMLPLFKGDRVGFLLWMLWIYPAQLLTVAIPYTIGYGLGRLF